MTSREKRRDRNEASTQRSDLENHDALTCLVSGAGAVIRASPVLCVERHAQGAKPPLPTRSYRAQPAAHSTFPACRRVNECGDLVLAPGEPGHSNEGRRMTKPPFGETHRESAQLGAMEAAGGHNSGGSQHL